MPGFIGLPEVLLLGLVVLVIFGPKRLPEMGRSLGRGFREFKTSITGDSKDDEGRFELPSFADDEVVELPNATPVQAVPAERKAAASR
ncbi:MAG: twin-arginine translocase TatA/TatE family subunit [Actinobacteria bacterium]|nr:twin-arginine translocase TatA/TatE family subunit [Actinomycetota bacterium]